MKTSYNEKLLRINLTTNEIKVEPLNLEIAKKFIGARGLGSKILLDEIDPSVDPLSSENKLVIMTGPVTGASVPTGGRYVVVTKSPLTGMIACSNSGGEWGAKLKYSGFDGIIIEGKSSTPKYLYINDDKVEILNAHHVWGKTSTETDIFLKEKYPQASVLNIAPGGENLSLMAAIINDTDRAAGRSGVGAVMGSKNLKAIVVNSSKNSIPVNNPDALRKELVIAMKKIKEDGVTGTGLPTYGTAVLVNIINETGSFPTNNWQGSYSQNAENISGETLTEKYLKRTYNCHRCPIGCGRVVEREGKEIGGPEYETLWAYGGNCGVYDIPTINEANFWCNELGLDAISVPCTIAAGMELYEKGLISENDCEGIPLKFGSKIAVVEWTKRIGFGETPLGKLMALGSQRLCEYYGHPEISMSVKKQELPAYDARGIQGIGLNYATSNRGGCHVRGYMISPEILAHPELLDRTVTDNKASWTKIFQDLTAVIDSMGMCLFTSFALNAEDYTNFLNAATGTEHTVTSLLDTGERIYNLERIFNKRAGMKPEDDKLPKRLLKEAIVDGPSKGLKSKLDIMLPEYYKARGWENAFPTKETLQKLGLEDLC
ncbi:aldehyde ferredoxin oxidoreductase family protein [Cetobacterium sp. 2G large]|uniref:aldehyde ferredoxin oxidoreductase family protein n=1 Tax=Cetobacterium sp. 2G large TaxID=2759680 RepID=UPI00163BE8BE|nr:aldehyde ferredoxin oxidoreductase family protein [Cetobacterium sp. 2G large]MBC2854294.1 aldehyde ferredoxin oxidoreductase family protein [Cetobacterium sp. 2G large]